MPNGNQPSLAASALKFVLIFGSGAAAWALLMRWLNREETAEAEQPQAALPTSPLAGFMPMPMPVPYPFAMPQFAQPQALPTPARNRRYEEEEYEDEDEEPAPKRRRRRSTSKRRNYADMTVDEVYDTELQKILKRAAKSRARADFEESELMDDLLSN